MKTIYQKLLMLCFAASMSVAVSAQVDVTASAGSSTSQSYSTLSAAFGAINAGTHQGIITIGISANTTEPANTSDTLYSSSVLSCNYTSVAIYPKKGYQKW